MPQNSLPPDAWKALLNGLMLSTFAAFVGRLMWHVAEVQRGNRRFWSLEVIYELPTALGMGFVGKGVAEWLEFSGHAETAVIIVLAYAGPRGLEALLAAWIKHRKP